MPVKAMVKSQICHSGKRVSVWDNTLKAYSAAVIHLLQRLTTIRSHRSANCYAAGDRRKCVAACTHMQAQVSHATVRATAVRTMHSRYTHVDI